ncbi:TetR/AcrR family transcriptional regulator [Leifsonia poae]|uniref:TetR/AcrR family transcriptional regulator n=1 Tax=Leifsonia poae TaxID=110933 RepID=UPI001CC0D8B8|nr:TetR/AcrR family transcriptional regulator [Leifsonia poae]
MTSPRSSAAERRDQVRELAAREFAERGLHGTSVEAIARLAGISQAYIFRLFGTKVALFCEVAVAAFDRTTDGMVAAAGQTRGPEALMMMGEEYKLLLRDRTTLLLQQQAFAACADPIVREQVRDAFARLWTTVAELSGLEPLRVKTFIAYGMLLNDLAALDVDAVDAPWARESRTAIPIDIYR